MLERVMAVPVGSTFAFDCETYPNYFLVAFKGEHEVFTLECGPGQCVDAQTLAAILLRFRLVSYNGRNFDMPILSLALKGADSEALFRAGQRIIDERLSVWNFEKAYNVLMPESNHIDLVEVVPLQGSLKMRAAQMHFQTIWDLPFAPCCVLSEPQKEIVKEYCVNDLDVTIALFIELSEEIALREQMSNQYGVDVRSKSDAQIAEAVIGERLKAMSGFKPKRPDNIPDEVWFHAPSWVQFASTELRTTLAKLMAEPFPVGESGAVQAPDWLKGHVVSIGQGRYQMGIGGLHSKEERITYRSSEKYQLIDRDVASYYPSIIMNQELFPPHLGRNFLVVYGEILEERLAAKKAGNKPVANSLKIVVNGSFGKLASKWSILYAPKLFLQVTITGQLALLMLIEMAEAEGITVISANTDGVVFYCSTSKKECLDRIISQWEKITNFVTEETLYSAYYGRDVNNYVAVKPDGKVKSKGAFTNPWADGKSIFRFHKNPVALVCTEAITEFLSKRTPIRTTIESCTDAKKFAVVRKVEGGASKDHVSLGKVVRWYWSRSCPGPITYEKNGNAVADSDNGRPMMQLPSSVPLDVDREAYIRRAEEALVDLGFFRCRRLLLNYG